MPHDARSVGVVRSEVSRELSAAGATPEAVDDAALVVSELVGNAVRHGRALPGGLLHACWDVAPGSVRVEVEDAGDGPSRAPAAPDDSAEGGRGLRLVQQLATRWGSARTLRGTAVWAELPTGLPAGLSRAGRRLRRRA